MTDNDESKEEIEPTQADAGAGDDAPTDHVPAGSDYVSDRKFADFPISPEVLKGITDLGYTMATPVQSKTIEASIAGKDMLVRAKTGTGKTCAFCVPIVERVEEGCRKASAVILAPTRELAQQIAEECSGIAKYRDVSIAVLVGGLPLGPQERVLEAGAEIIVGTPGRVLDHIRRKNLDLSEAHVTCLDEADEMLSMGFFEDVTKIINATRKDRQVLLYSATISADTQRLVEDYLKEPENIRLSTDADGVNLIEHVLYETDPNVHKIRSLLFLLDNENPTSAIIFCNTREDTATVARFLDRQGLDVQLLSGELSQARRSQVMKRVKSGAVRFLVATDVAARGIDISDLSHVINYSLPQDAAVYTHRTGRTGRIGKKGTAINLVGGSDIGTKKTLENQYGITFTIRELPDAEACVRKRVERQSQQIRAAMGTMVFEGYLPTVRALKEAKGGDALLAAALRAFFTWDRQRRIEAGEIHEVAQSKDTGRNARYSDDDGGGRKGRGRDRDRKGGRDRKGRDRDRDRDRDRKPRKSRDRGEKRSEKRAESTEDLDALLVGGGSPAPASDAKPKRKRKRKRKSQSGDNREGGEATARPKSADLDDLDALLSK